MNTSFNGQTGIITGAASGLGRAIAQKLSGQGINLALFDKNEEGLKATQAALSGKSTIHPLDITDEQAVAAAIANVANHYKHIDILINSAGITGKTNIKSHEVDTADLLNVFHINFMGSCHTSKYVLREMLRRNYGRILHIASIAGKEGNAGMLAYSASKAAVIGMTKVQGKEYATTGITINALAPAVTTGSLKAIEIARAADDRRAKLMRHTRRFRDGLSKAGFELLPGETPIIPVMLGEATRAQNLAKALDQRGVYVAGFFFPVVPQGKARIRTQMSAAHTRADLDRAIAAFTKVGRTLGVIS